MWHSIPPADIDNKRFNNTSEPTFSPRPRPRPLLERRLQRGNRMDDTAPTKREDGSTTAMSPLLPHSSSLNAKAATRRSTAGQSLGGGYEKTARKPETTAVNRKPTSHIPIALQNNSTVGEVDGPPGVREQRRRREHVRYNQPTLRIHSLSFEEQHKL